nr:nuclease-related domain-containing protein [Geomicrobium sp. JCM 19037]
MDEREKSAELTLLRLLNKRMRLDAPEHLHSLEKGFVGECHLDKWLNSVTSDCIILNDLWLQYKQSLFQVDTLIIFPEKIFILMPKIIAEITRWMEIIGRRSAAMKSKTRFTNCNDALPSCASCSKALATHFRSNPVSCL